jgi:ABC-type nitrate/sulfonate/bicarbonate transport systems, periplasmic components
MTKYIGTTRAALVAFFALFCMYGTAQAAELKHATLALQWLPQAQFAGYYVAQAKGYYQDVGVDLTIRPGGPDIVASREMTEGRAQFATMFLSTGVELRAKGMPLAHLSQLVQHSALLLILKATSPVHDLKDLNGRPVGLWDNEFQLQPRALFHRLGITPRIVPQSGSLALFLLGGVEAASGMWYNEYHTLLASGLDPKDMRVFFYRDLGLDFPEDGLYTLDSTLKADPELCRAVVAASLRGWQYAFDHEEEALKIIMDRMHKDKVSTNLAHQRFMLRRMRDVMLGDGKTGNHTPPLGHLDQGDYDRVAAALLEQKMIQAKPAFTEFSRGGTR